MGPAAFGILGSRLKGHRAAFLTEGSAAPGLRVLVRPITRAFPVPIARRVAIMRASVAVGFATAMGEMSRIPYTFARMMPPISKAPAVVDDHGRSVVVERDVAPAQAVLTIARSINTDIIISAAVVIKPVAKGFVDPAAFLFEKRRPVIAVKAIVDEAVQDGALGENQTVLVRRRQEECVGFQVERRQG